MVKTEHTMQTTITALTSGPQHHFHGGYGAPAWDHTERYHLALETDFHGRRPRADDLALVGLVNRLTGRFIPYNATSAFNLHQGNMMHWIQVTREPTEADEHIAEAFSTGVPTAEAGADAATCSTDCATCGCTTCLVAPLIPEEFTFTAIKDDALISYAINPVTKARYTIHGAIAAVSPAGPVAIGLDYLRIAHCRPGAGYASDLPAAVADVPTDDGLFHLDLEDGHAELLLSIADVVGATDFDPATGQRVWFNHVRYNPSGERLAFLCRAALPTGFLTSLWTVNADGSDPRCQIPFGHTVTHHTWIDDARLLLSTDLLGPQQFVAFRDGQRDFAPYGNGRLPADGRACFSPDGRQLAVTTFTETATRPVAHLSLYDTVTGEMHTLGAFRQPHALHSTLHPRWSRDGQHLTFDSAHEGTRQIYVAELEDG